MSSLAPTAESFAHSLFQCAICHENVNDATICTQCSKLYCRGCKTTPNCPDCPMRLYVQQVVICRSADEVQQKEVTRQKEKSEASALEKSVERCQVHERTELSVYCDTCQRCICHECALWSQNHAGHTFKPLDEIYAQYCEQIRQHIPSLQRHSKDMSEGMQVTQANIAIMKNAKLQIHEETQTALEQLSSRLEIQYRALLRRLDSHRNDLTLKYVDIKGLIDKAHGALFLTPKAETISKCVLILQDIESVLTESIADMPPVVADLQSYLVPDYDSKTFAIENYSQFRRKGGFVITTPLSANGLEWQLKVMVYVPVAGCLNRSPFLGIFLELTSGPAEGGDYEGSIEMMQKESENTSKNFKQPFSHNFKVGQSLVKLHFYRLDLLESDGFLNKTTDCIMLRLNVRPPTYNQRCKDLKCYIARLEETNPGQSKDIDHLRREAASSNLSNNTLAESSSAGLRRTRKTRRQHLAQQRFKRKKLQAGQGAGSDYVSESESPADPKVVRATGKLAALPHSELLTSNEGGDGVAGSSGGSSPPTHDNQNSTDDSDSSHDGLIINTEIGTSTSEIDNDEVDMSASRIIRPLTPTPPPRNIITHFYNP